MMCSIRRKTGVVLVRSFPLLPSLLSSLPLPTTPVQYIYHMRTCPHSVSHTQCDPEIENCLHAHFPLSSQREAALLSRKAGSGTTTYASDGHSHNALLILCLDGKYANNLRCLQLVASLCTLCLPDFISGSLPLDSISRRHGENKFMSLL